MHCGDQRHLGLCLGYVPALAYGSCRVSEQGTTLRASDLYNARATIINPFNNTQQKSSRTSLIERYHLEFMKLFSVSFSFSQVDFMIEPFPADTCCLKKYIPPSDIV